MPSDSPYPPSSDALRQAADLLRAGQQQAAQSILLDYVRQNPGSEQGWYLLSFAFTDAVQRGECLKRVLRINPSNERARQLLERQTTAGQRLAQSSESGAKVNPQGAAAFAPDSPGPVVSSISSGDAARPAPVDDSLAALRPAVDEKPTAAAQHPVPRAPSAGVTQQAGATKQALAKRPAGAKQPPLARKKTGRPAWLLPAIFVPVFLLLAAAAFFAWRMTAGGAPELAQPVAVMPEAPVLPIATEAPQDTFPPTWTPMPIQPTATARPTVTLTPFPTPLSPAPTVLAEMLRIEGEVAQVRGLPVQKPVARYMITHEMASDFLTDLLIDEDYHQALQDQGKVLAALGLVKPDYDLTNYAVNSYVDSLGGLYIPWREEIYVLGYRFYGGERFVYSHEFGHALVDQHFDLNHMGVYPYCESNQQRCDAVRALVEGDASLVMIEWLMAYASPQDIQGLINYHPRAQALPEENPPPYVEQDLLFPYNQGAEFVQFLYKRGKWEAVNAAYRRLPESTEQILHPPKYLAGEAPIPVEDRPLETVLGPGWRLLVSDVLGEWSTYLLLGYGADAAYQLDAETAQAAAAGWGGDKYQVYIQDGSGSLALAAHWVWDTPGEAQEFGRAFESYLNRRFQSARLEHAGGACWQSEGQAICLFVSGSEALWLLGPDIEKVDALKLLYPGIG